METAQVLLCVSPGVRWVSTTVCVLIAVERGMNSSSMEKMLYKMLGKGIFSCYHYSN
jgi:hypothetical protein